MITIMKKSIGVILLIFIFFVVATLTDYAAPPTPPQIPPTDPSVGETYIGGVPIAGGLLIMIALAVSYGARKLYNERI